jgi:hypothetical protein
LGFVQASTELLHAPILRSPSNEDRRIIATHQQFCFDLMIEIEINFGATSRFTAAFINTTDGYIGYTHPERGGAINVLMPEVESFEFTVISYKLGNIYMYKNRKASRGYGIDHLVSTSNTETHDYQQMNNLIAAPLSRKTERRSYCNGNMEATAYKRDDGPTKWFVYGGDYTTNHTMPATLQVQKYLGVFGVGVITTDWGNFILTEVTNGSGYAAIKNIERTHVCFDPTNYKLTEANFYQKQAANLAAEREKINRDEADAQRAECCVAERMEVINFRRAQLQVQEDNLRNAQSGNLLQNNNAQKGMLSTMDYNANVHLSLLSTKVAICNVRYAMGKDPSKAASYSGKLSCLEDQQSNLVNLEAQMNAIDARYNSGNAMDLVRRNTEKARVYMQQGSRQSCN